MFWFISEPRYLSEVETKTAEHFIVAIIKVQTREAVQHVTSFQLQHLQFYLHSMDFT